MILLSGVAMDRKSRRQWIAAEVLGITAIIAAGASASTRWYGTAVLVLAIGSAVAAVFLGLRRS
jgi:hypothetical protein